MQGGTWKGISEVEHGGRSDLGRVNWSELEDKITAIELKWQNELCQTLKIAVSCSLSQANSIFARLSRGSVSAKASFGRLSHSDGIYAVRFLLYNLQ